MSQNEAQNSEWYVLLNSLENEDEDAILEGESDYLDRIEVSFSEGKKLPFDDFLLPIEINVYEYALRGNMTDHLSFDDISGPVFSTRAKEAFEKIGIKEVQYFPIKIIDEYSNAEDVYLANLRKREKKFETQTIDGFFVANFYDLVDCIDHEKSECEYFLPSFELSADMPKEMKLEFESEVDLSIDLVKSLVLDESKIPEKKMFFRLKDRDEILVCNQKVIEMIAEENLSGFVFCSVGEYSEEIPDEDDEDQAEIEDTYFDSDDNQAGKDNIYSYKLID